MNLKFLIILISCFLFISCKKENNSLTESYIKQSSEGMIWISGGEYERGALDTDTYSRKDEKPRHKVSIDGFWMDITEVTNAQFKKFIEETRYVTTAEKAIDWEELKQQLPISTNKPHDSILQPGSLSFHCLEHEVVNLNPPSNWWKWQIGVNWKSPDGKDSSIDGKESFPVVHVSYNDALAYCKWAKRRLPTEAEWEFAARGGLESNLFPWGNDKNILSKKANTWQGKFPVYNTKEDGFVRSAPVKSYSSNGYGLYDMLGNVWEWTQDWYGYDYYKIISKSTFIKNPIGPKKTRKSNKSNAKEKVIRGGSFLCHDSYCSSYRVSARMSTSIDTGLEHLGFRTIVTPKMLKASKILH